MNLNWLKEQMDILKQRELPLAETDHIKQSIRQIFNQLQTQRHFALPFNAQLIALKQENKKLKRRVKHLEHKLKRHTPKSEADEKSAKKSSPTLFQ